MADNIDDLIKEKQINEDILDVSNRLVSALKERFKLGAQITENERLLFGVSKQLQQTALSLTSSIEKRNNFSVKAKDLAKDIVKLEENKRKSLELQSRTSAQLLKDQTSYYDSSIKLGKSVLYLNKQIADEYARQDILRAGDATRNREELSASISRVRLLERNLSLVQREKNNKESLLKVTKETIIAQQRGINATDSEIENLNKELELRKKIERSLGITGGAITLLSKIPGLGNIIKADEAKKNMEDLAIQMQKDGKDVSSFGNRAKIAFEGIKTSATALKEELPQLTLLFLISQANKADQQTTKLAKSMMQTKVEAMQTREQFVGMANASGDAFINTDKLLEANAALGKQLGFNKVFSQDINQTFVDLTKKVGLSEEAAGGLARISIATGRTLKATEQTIAGTTSKISAQNGVQLDGQQILEESGKISGQLLANFKGNPAAIAEAVAQTKILGTTLEQTKSQAGKLLDFESSIGNQLKAELLTGQQLNLERARTYALQGNQVGVAKELTKQGMDFNKFSRLNVIQQNAFAEALGLSSDQLSDQLLKQEAIGKSRSEIVALGGEEAAKRLEALAAQDKFNSAVEKLKDLFGNIVGGPLGTVIDILSDAVSLVGKLISGIQSILGNTGMKAVLGAATGFAVGGPLGALIGGAAGLVSGIASNADDMTGYGARALITPSGTVALNNNDTVIAGTNLFRGDDVASFPKGALSLGGDTSKMENLLERLVNKSTILEVNGRTIATESVRSTYKSA